MTGAKANPAAAVEFTERIFNNLLPQRELSRNVPEQTLD
jgi:hypothetical protein